MREPNRVGTTQRHHFLNREPSHSENRNYLRNGHRGSWKVTFNPVRLGDQPIPSPQRDLVEGTSHHGDEIAGSDGENVGTGDHTGASELEGGLGADNDVEAVAGEGEVHVGIALGLVEGGRGDKNGSIAALNEAVVEEEAESGRSRGGAGDLLVGDGILHDLTESWA